MRVISKLMFVLLFTIAVFVLVIGSFLYISYNQKKIVDQNNSQNKNLIVDRMVQSKTERFEVVRNEYTAWDEMIEYCAEPDEEFFDDNFAPLNESYGTAFVSIYNKELDPVIAYYDSAVTQVEFSPEKETMLKLFEDQAFCHFFQYHDEQLLEVFGANVVPATDLIERATPSQGFLMLGKVWDEDYILELEEATGASIAIIDVASNETTDEEDVLVLSRTLYDSLKTPIAQLNFSFKNDSAKQLKSMSNLSYGLLILAVVAVLFFMFMLRHIIGKPIILISQSLNSYDESVLDELTSRQDEFGKIAEMIHDFFMQKKQIEETYVLLEDQKNEIEKQNRSIQSSIEYAKRIQEAVLPDMSEVEEKLPMHFVFFKPRDIVSGDFYWTKIQDERILVAAADCTGHGVPGAFMSILGITQLNDIVKEIPEIEPHEILNSLRDRLKNLLSQTNKSGARKEGIDIALCAIKHNVMKIDFAGAYNSLFLVRKQKTDEGKLYEIIETRGDRMPVGFYPREKKSFTLHSMDIESGDAIYLSSDGLSDQFGGEKGRKFMWTQLKEMIIKLQDIPFDQQLAYIENEFYTWKGENRQIDDILVFGFKIK